ncbi:MAG TPA: hypothetical protein VE912_10215 [Bacteroidales bacterium]|nr:hypothetical protein [Bacteroidales bacterium]
MLKKYRNILIVSVLIIVAVILYLTHGTGTMGRNYTNLALNNPSAVSKLELKKNDSTVYLTRHGSKWYLNDSLRANSQLVEVILEYLSRIRIVGPVPKSLKDSLLKVKNHGMFVTVYHRNRPAKQFIYYHLNTKVGSDVLLPEGGRQPVLVEITGFSGSLSKLLRMNSSFWFDHAIFDFNYSEITSLSIMYNEKPKKSFVLKRTSNGSFQLTLATGDSAPVETDQQQTILYLSQLENIKYEKRASDSVVAQIQNQNPYFTLLIVLENGQKREINGFRKMGNSAIDFNYFYVQALPRNEVYVVRYIDFDPLLVSDKYFLDH